MRTHPFLRAYMAGITLPTIVLLVIMSADALHRASGSTSLYGIDVMGLERALIFPMAFVPNVWGLWNAVYLAIHRRQPSWPLGLHGAILVPFLSVGGLTLLRTLDVVNLDLSAILPVLPFGMVAYYLFWKFVVGFLNREMGIA